MRVALQHLPVLVARDERNLFDLKASFEEAAGAFMAKVAEVKVFYPKFHAGPAERGPDGARVLGDDATGVVRAPALRHQDLPGVIACKIDKGDTLVIPILVARVLPVTDSDGAAALVNIWPFDGADLRLAHGGCYGKGDKARHRRLLAGVAVEAGDALVELFLCRTAVSLLRLRPGGPARTG